MSEPKETKPLPPWAGGCMGLVMSLSFFGMGLFIILISFDVIPTPPENFNAPRIVVAAAGLVFALAGIMIFISANYSEEEMNKPLLAWVRSFLVFLIMVAFSSVFLWVGFGPGEREFQSSTSFGGVTSTGEGSSFFGRLLFGGVGLLCGLGTLWVSFVQIRSLIQKTFHSDSSQNDQLSDHDR